jgi:hypothetical protein
VSGFTAYLALRQQGLNGGPSLTLRSIAEKIHNDGTLLDCLVHIEQIGTRDPAILNGLFPRGAVFSDSDNDIQAIVT